MVDFPRVEVSGGPHGRGVRVKIDGKEMTGVYQLEIDAAVNDTIRLRLFQFVKVEVDAQMEVEPPVYRVAVPAGDLGVFESTADSILDALRDCVRQLELRRVPRTDT